MTRYYAAGVGILLVFLGIGVLMQLTISSAPAHGGKVTITGHVVNRLLKHFEGSSGLHDVNAIETRRLTMGPGATMTGDFDFHDHAELCLVEKGSVTFTLADGSTRTFRAGDIYITPLGAKQKKVAADPKLGFQEVVWVIKTGKH